MMNAAQAQDSSEVIMGKFPVNSTPAKVLFYTGASHYFMSRSFVSKHDFVSEMLGKPMGGVSPARSMRATTMIPNVSIEVGDYRFLYSPMVLGDSDIDLILGMDWLSKHKAQLDCAARQIQLTHSSKDVIVFAAHDNTIRLFYLNEKGELDAICQIPVVCEYQDVFPEELPGMPPHQPVEFVIDLEPGTEPVCKRPYKLGLEELKELKKQHDERSSGIGLFRSDHG